METLIEKLYKMRLNPAHPMADGSDYATRLPPEILIRTFRLIPDDATACMKTCKTSKDPAINVHWRKFNNQRFKNLFDMNDKEIKAGYIAHARDIAIKFSEHWYDLPDWFPSSTTQPKNEYYNACTGRDGKGINTSHLITPKLRSLELVGFNTRHFVLALCQITGLETLRFKPLSDSYMEFLPIVSCCPALKNPTSWSTRSDVGLIYSAAEAVEQRYTADGQDPGFYTLLKSLKQFASQNTLSPKGITASRAPTRRTTPLPSNSQYTPQPSSDNQNGGTASTQLNQAYDPNLSDEWDMLFPRLYVGDFALDAGGFEGVDIEHLMGIPQLSFDDPH
ncbi:hypothetical protein D6D25_08996 [Aureobasidium pullulans]|nr:hypothetical protein D6D25_08996 [Aureobasidium pullulans]